MSPGFHSMIRAQAPESKRPPVLAWIRSHGRQRNALTGHTKRLLWLSKTGPNILPEDLFKFPRLDDKHVGMIWQSYVIRSDFSRTGPVFVENFLNLIIGQHSARDVKNLLC